MNRRVSPEAVIVLPGRSVADERTVVTPEGVPLHWELGSRAERFSAFALDMLILVAAVAAVITLLNMLVVRAWFGDFDSLAFVAALVGLFLLRNFYFTISELALRGRTPGKFFLGLRVVDATGGPLQPGSIVARNLMREVEIFLPLVVTLFPRGFDLPGAAALLGICWLAFVGGLPLFNRDRQRLGDLLGGTWVIRQPRLQLLPDLGSAEAAAVESGPAYAFDRRQIEVYGIRELQTLEMVLRSNAREVGMTRAKVARTIQVKIGWSGPVDDPDGFLAAYYAALRAHLEGRLTLGERLEDKAAAAARLARQGRRG